MATSPQPLGLEVLRDPVGDVQGGRVLFVTDNGHGLGHLTRMMALARRFAERSDLAFVTSSKAYPLVRAAGFAVEYLPAFVDSQEKWSRWASGAEDQLTAAVDGFDPDVLVIDHVRPWRFLARLRDRSPAVRLVWSRRGLWRPGRNLDVLDRAEFFDLVLEPLDLAALRDRGGTVQRAGAARVPPITLLDRHETLDRDAARQQLGLPGEGTCVVLQLSSDETSTLEHLLSIAIEQVARIDPGVTVFVPLHPLHPETSVSGANVRSCPVYPLSRFSSAFDLAISTAGYNTFHELVVAGLPTVFVARDTATLDDQVLRASLAPATGIGLHVPTLEATATFRSALRSILDPVEQERMRLAAAQLIPSNGAQPAAARLSLLARSG